HPDRFAVMGLLDLAAPGALDQIATWRQQPGMLGLRLNFKVEGDPRDDRVWAAAEAAEVQIMMSIPHDQLDVVEQVAQRHPALKLVIDNLAIPSNKKDDQAFAHLGHLLPLAKYPTIAVKASSLPYYTNDSYPYRRLHPYLRRIYDAFGPQRIFWGSEL